MDRKPLHIMAIGAHIGDVELTCGKTLAKHSLLGDRITTVALTAGERGCPPSYTMEDFKKMNIQSAGEFARMLNGQSIVFNYRDGEIPDNEEIRFQICDLIRREKPDVLLTHWKNSMHKDHITTHRVVVDGHFYAALRTMERELPSHWTRGPYFADNWEDAEDFRPYLYVDVTEAMELWREAIKKLWLSTNATFKYLEYYDALSRVRGAVVGRERAEVFAVDPIHIKQVVNSF